MVSNSSQLSCTILYTFPVVVTNRSFDKALCCPVNCIACLIQQAITLKMAARNFLPKCILFFNRIPIESLRICNSNAMHLGKKFLAAIFSVTVYHGDLIETAKLSHLNVLSYLYLILFRCCSYGRGGNPYNIDFSYCV